jgi:dTDP-4-dehydrorhamnose reductase
VYGSRGGNFLLTMLGCSTKPSFTSSMTVRAPTWVGTSRKSPPVLGQCLLSDLTRERLQAEQSGIYHLTGADRRPGLGSRGHPPDRALLGKAGGAQADADFSSDYPVPAKRPSNSLLSNEKIRNTFGIEQQPWEDYRAPVITRSAQDLKKSVRLQAREHATCTSDVNRYMYDRHARRRQPR